MKLTLGERIRKARKGKGLTQAELGYLVSVHEITVRRWELGERFPDTEALSKLSKVLDVSVSEFMGEDDDNTIPKDSSYNAEMNSASVVSSTSTVPSMSYWGSVTDNARIVAENGDLGEIFSVKALLNRALDILSLGENQLQETAINREMKKSAPFVQVGGSTKNSYSRINIGEVQKSSLVGTIA